MTTRQACPLCGNDADYGTADMQNRKHFFCGTCTEFQISTHARGQVEESTPQRRAELSKLAREHPEGKTLVILLRPTADGGGLDVRYVLNSELPEVRL